MSRRIIAARRVDPRAVQDPGAPTPDDYLGRLVKYIPAEIVGLYLATSGVVPQTDRPVLWGVFIACWILVPLYFWFATTRGGNPPLVSQIVLGTMAFPVWVLAIGGAFVKQFEWYETRPYLPSILLCLVTVVFGLYRPAPE